MGAPSVPSAPRIIGRYALYGRIASGGMATVHFGRLLGPVGFSRTVAIKRLHPHYTEDPEFVSMFLDEARLAARIRHPNVVPTLDVVATEGELFLVMEYIQGETLARLLRLMAAKRERIPLPIVIAIFSGMLHGLHAAHEAKNERGEHLGIVHRDVSPQNVIVGVDGIPRVLDFGVAKATGRLQTTREGQLKGKLSYMAPEQLRGGTSTRQTDIYAAGVVLWEVLTGQRLFQEENEGAVLQKVLAGVVEPPSAIVPGLPPALDGIIARALREAPEDRFATAREMASALERDLPHAIPATVGGWVEETAEATIAKQAARVAEIESETSGASVMVAQPERMSSRPPTPRPAAGAEVDVELGIDTLTVDEDGDATIAMDPHAPASGTPDLSGASQMSSISVSTPAWPRSLQGERRKFATAVAAGALGAVVLVALLIVALRGSRSESPVTAGAAPSASTPPAVAVASSPPTPSDVPTPSAAPMESSPTVAGTLPPPAVSHPRGTSKSTSSPAAATQKHAAPPPAPAPKPKSGILFTNPG